MNMSAPFVPQVDPLSGVDLFHICQRLARKCIQQAIGPQLLPCGARSFYYTRLVLLRQGVKPTVEPTEVLVPREVSASFLRVLPHIADRLGEEFGRAVQLLIEPTLTVPQLLQEQPVPHTPILQQKLAEWAGVAQIASSQWAELWETCWQHIQAQHVSALKSLLVPAWLLVAPVARADDLEGAALQLLRARLAQDAVERSWRVPPSGIYLYDEPLVHWLMWRLLQQPWFKELWKSVAIIGR